MDNTWTETASFASKIKDDGQSAKLLKLMLGEVAKSSDWVDDNALAGIAASASKLSDEDQALELLRGVWEQSTDSRVNFTHHVWTAVAMGASKLKDETKALRLLKLMQDRVYPMGDDKTRGAIRIIARSAAKLSDQKYFREFLTLTLSEIQGKHQRYKSYVLADVAWCAILLRSEIHASALLRQVLDQAEELDGDSQTYVVIAVSRSAEKRGIDLQTEEKPSLTLDKSASLGVQIIYDALEIIVGGGSAQHRITTLDAAPTYAQFMLALEQIKSRKINHRYRPLMLVAPEASRFLDDTQAFTLLKQVLEQTQGLDGSSRPLAAVADGAVSLSDKSQAFELLRDVLAQTKLLGNPFKYPALAAIASNALSLKDDVRSSELLRQVLKQSGDLETASKHKLFAMVAAAATPLRNEGQAAEILTQITEMAKTQELSSHYPGFAAEAARALQIDDRKQMTEMLRELIGQTRLQNWISRTLTVVATNASKINASKIDDSFQALELLARVLDRTDELSVSFKYNPLAAVVNSASKLSDVQSMAELRGRVQEQAQGLDHVSKASILATIAVAR
jgi:hypothetical protein